MHFCWANSPQNSTAIAQKIHFCRLFLVDQRRDQSQIMQPKCIISVSTVQKGDTAKVYTNAEEEHMHTQILPCLVLRRCLSPLKQRLRDIQHVADSTETLLSSCTWTMDFSLCILGQTRLGVPKTTTKVDKTATFSIQGEMRMKTKSTWLRFHKCNEVVHAPMEVSSQNVLDSL